MFNLSVFACLVGNLSDPTLAGFMLLTGGPLAKDKLQPDVGDNRLENAPK